MTRMLSWRVLLPALFAFAVLPYTLSGTATDVLLIASPLPALYAVFRSFGRERLGRAMLGCDVIALVLLAIAPLDRILNDGKPGVFGAACYGFAALAFYGGCLSLLRARRPDNYRDGVFDGFAALAGIVTVQWQWLELSDDATSSVVAAQVPPLLVGFLLISTLLLFWGLARDPAQSRAVLVSFCLSGALLAAAAIATASFSGEVPGWSVSMFLLGGYFFAAAVAHPGLGAMFAPEPSRRRIISMRWLGPALSLVATPIMMGMFVARQAVPSVPVALACFALTGIALWRGSRILRDREQTRQELRDQQRFRSLVEYAGDVILVVDAHRRVTYAGGGVQAVLGHDAESLIGADVAGALRTDVAVEELYGRGSHDVQLRRPDGSSRWVVLHASDHRDTADIAGWVVNVRDITDRKQAEEALADLALRDPLTALPNRAGLQERLVRVLGSGGATALLFCDLDDFKEVNDRYGHEAGDELLRVVAGRWSERLRAFDLLGRWGGDEFLVICPDVSTRAEAEDIRDRLAAGLDEPIRLSGGDARVGVSIGISLQTGSDTPASLISRADLAMYETKRARID